VRDSNVWMSYPAKLICAYRRNDSVLRLANRDQALWNVVALGDWQGLEYRKHYASISVASECQNSKSLS